MPSAVVALPGSQPWQLAVPPRLYVPLEQSVQAVPWTLLRLPARHAVHSEESADDVIPVLHARHVVSEAGKQPTAAKLPASQFVHSTHLIDEAFGWVHVLGHAVQASDWDLLEYIPSIQSSHCWFCCNNGRPAMRRPAGHVVQVLQTVEPLSFWNVTPSSHGRHAI